MLAIDLDADINSLVYTEVSEAGIKLLGMRVIPLLGLGQTEKERYLVEEIAQAVDELKIKDREAFVCFRGASLYLGRHTLPDMPSKEIPGALRWQIKGANANTEEEIIFDYEFVKETTDAEGAKNKYYLVTLGQRKEIETACDIIEKSGLKPIKLNVSPFCTAKLLPKDIDPAKIYATLEVAWTASTLSCYQNQKLIFARIIPTGIRNLIHALGISVVYKGNNISLDEMQAWRALSEVGIPYNNTGEEWQGFPLSQLLVLMRPELERLSTELKRSLDYFSISLKDGPIEKIFVTGIGLSIKGLSQFLSENIRLPLENLNTKVETEENLTPADLGIASCSLGNILSGTDKVNLLPAEYRLGELKLLKAISRTGSLLISIIFLASLLIIGVKNNIYSRQLAFLASQNQIFDKLANINKEVGERENIKATLAKGGINFDWVLKEMAQVLPPNVLFSSLKISKDTKKIEINGIIFSSEFPESTVTEMMNGIEKSKLLYEPQLGWLKKNSETQRADFKMNLRLK